MISCCADFAITLSNISAVIGVIVSLVGVIVVSLLTSKGHKIALLPKRLVAIAFITDVVEALKKGEKEIDEEYDGGNRFAIFLLKLDTMPQFAENCAGMGIEIRKDDDGKVVHDIKWFEQLKMTLDTVSMLFGSRDADISGIKKWITNDGQAWVDVSISQGATEIKEDCCKIRDIVENGNRAISAMLKEAKLS